MLRVRDLNHYFSDSPVLRDVSLDVRSGEVLGLIGPNGSGKTTLLRSLYGALTPRTGRVEFDGVDLRKIPPRKLAQRIAVVAQEPTTDLMFTVADVVLMGRIPHLRMLDPRNRRDERLATESLDRVGLLDLADREFGRLSGGEKQRVLIARALTQEAECMLLDEPTNHLDISYQHQVLQLVRDLGITAVVVLHDLNLAARYCDSLVLLSAGQVSAQGSPNDILTKEFIEPVYHINIQAVLADDYTAQLLFRRTSILEDVTIADNQVESANV